MCVLLIEALLPVYKCENISTSLACLKLLKFELKNVLVVIICVVSFNVLQLLFCSLKGKLLNDLYNDLFNIILTWLEFEESEK